MHSGMAAAAAPGAREEQPSSTRGAGGSVLAVWLMVFQNHGKRRHHPYQLPFPRTTAAAVLRALVRPLQEAGPHLGGAGRGAHGAPLLLSSLGASSLCCALSGFT